MNNNGKSVEGVRLNDIFPLIEEKLKSGGEVTFKPHGISMLPLIRQGKDSAKLKQLDREARKFDVIFYRRPDGQFVLHRIIGKDKRGFVLCGDNQFIKEYGVSESWIIGVLTSVSREGKGEILCESAEMKLYCRFLFLRRIYLRGKSFIRRVMSKLKRMIKK